ncbi:YceD family protein [Trichloromonas sp.]|uniref:YceD family protein n=1 Tax=Trichloromonas sp. TaxID=3069249 RepID=UPI003D81498F
MQIRIADIKDNGLSLDLVEGVESFPVLQELQGKGECLFTQPVTVNLRAFVVSGMVEISGHVATAAEIACSRCLKPAEVAVDSRFDLTYTRELPEVEDEGEDGSEITAEDMGLILFDGDEIDLLDAIQEQVVLALPFNPLCSRNCRGLCPQCGADLNEQACSCGPQDYNIKFSALKNFKVDK